MLVHPSRAFSRARALTATAAALAALLAPGSAAGAVPSERVAVSHRAVTDYWTEARMAAARPGSELLARVRAPQGVLDGILGGSGPRRADPVGDASKRPFSAHGKVFFTLDGLDFVCSGTVVEADNKRLVTTAGHCVYGFGSFATNWMFVPGKEGSDEPYGRWTARSLATTPQWQASEDIRYDVGMAVMARRDGERIQRAVGARGIAFKQGRDLFFRAYGYPAEDPYNGGQLYRCPSEAQGHDTGPPPQPTRIECDMTGGSSGGGWIISGGRLNSVISYGYECGIGPLPLPIPCDNPEEGKLFGPYFGAAVQKLYRAQQRPLSTR